LFQEGIAEASVTSWNSKNALVSDIVSNFDLDTTVSLLGGEKGSASTSAPADPQSYPLLFGGSLALSVVGMPVRGPTIPVR